MEGVGECKEGEANRVQKTDCSKEVAGVGMELVLREVSTVEGKINEKEREDEMIIEKGKMDSMGLGELASKLASEKGINKTTKVKGRKWKFQARERAIKGVQLTEPITLKISSREQISPSPKGKKKRIGRPIVPRAN